MYVSRLFPLQEEFWPEWPRMYGFKLSSHVLEFIVTVRWFSSENPGPCCFRIGSEIRSFTHELWIFELTQNSRSFSGCLRIALAGTLFLIREKCGNDGTNVPLTVHNPNG